MKAGPAVLALLILSTGCNSGSTGKNDSPLTSDTEHKVDQLPHYKPDRDPGNNPDRNPEQKPGNGSDDKPWDSPEQNPGDHQKPGQKPNQKPHQNPWDSPEQSPGQNPGQEPGQAPGQLRLESAPKFISFRIEDPGFFNSEPQTRDAERMWNNRAGEKARLLMAQVSQGARKFRVFLEPETVRMVALEEIDPTSGKLKAFRHAYVASGVTRWSAWLPAELRGQSSGLWPVDGEARVESNDTLSMAMELGDRVEQELEANRELFVAASEAVLSAEDWWTPGEHVWSYRPERWKPWIGYIWSYNDGSIWRGYRLRKPGEIFSPSQELSPDSGEAIASYYSNLDPKISSTYDPVSSRAVSPMDKWGIWLERTRGLRWWDAPAWEAFYHGPSADWAGHCNGSAAAALLWEKPRKSFTDHGLTWDPRDIAGILESASNRVDYLFWGHRYRGTEPPTPDDDIKDPDPVLLIRLFQKYLGESGTPLIVDTVADSEVQNKIVSEVRIHVTPTSDPHVFSGVLRLMMHESWTDRKIERDAQGLIPDGPVGDDRVLKDYAFTIRTAENGSLKSASWVDNWKHPDFAWLPVRNNDYPGTNSRNPHLPIALVRQLALQSY